MAPGGSLTRRARAEHKMRAGPLRRCLVVALTIALVQGSCDFLMGGGDSGLDSTAVLETSVAQLLTQAPWATASTPAPTAAGPGGTPLPPDLESATATLIATGCFNRAMFVADISIPDDTALAPDMPFTKTWRLRNNGTCGWSEEYALVFAGGEGMSGQGSQPLGRMVPPGSEIDVSIDLVAPSADGTYRGTWMLRSPQGNQFGIGPSGDLPFWVQIQVGPGTTPPSGNALVYSFADHVCEADWRSGIGLLPCPGTETDPNGYVALVRTPRLENGWPDDEPVISMHPEWNEDGTITGRFPAVFVPDGSHFRTIIGCAWNAHSCEVVFQLNYRIGDGPLQNLGQWTEVYDSRWRSLDLDLTALAGQRVAFVLAVLANGPATQDLAYWLSPVILH